MHELSIASRLVEIATEHAQQAGADKITAIRLRIGTLSGVHRSPLEFGFELVTQGTLLEGATLTIVDVPVAVFCAECQQVVDLPSVQRFQCPICDAPSADIRRGNELEIESLEIIPKEPVTQ